MLTAAPGSGGSGRGEGRGSPFSRRQHLREPKGEAAGSSFWLSQQTHRCPPPHTVPRCAHPDLSSAAPLPRHSPAALTCGRQWVLRGDSPGAQCGTTKIPGMMSAGLLMTPTPRGRGAHCCGQHPGPQPIMCPPEIDRVTPSREFIEVLDCGEFAAAKQTLVWRGTGRGTGRGTPVQAKSGARGESQELLLMSATPFWGTPPCFPQSAVGVPLFVPVHKDGVIP